MISWPAELMKGNRRHSIPLTPMVAEVLKDLPKAALLFPSMRIERSRSATRGVSGG
jgi:integrase